MKYIFVMVLLTFAALLSPSAFSLTAQSPDNNDIIALVSGNNDFALSLYSQLKNDPKVTKSSGNLFFSSYSISTALAMTYAGARSTTQSQMASALKFDLPESRLHNAFAALQNRITNPDKSAGYQLLVANALWGQAGQPFLKDFLDINLSYHAKLAQLDFATQPEPSRQVINTWVESKTNQKIKELLPSGSVNGALLVLTNAVYFKGDWNTEFEAKNTKDEKFAASDSSSVKIKMMHMTGSFKYFENKIFQALELPYKGNDLSMIILLPRKSQSLDAAEQTLTPAALNELTAKMYETNVAVSFPKFKIICGTFSLVPHLEKLGMPIAFTRAADFSAMTGRHDVLISDVLHKAFVEVNEQGTEAAAATAVVMKIGNAMAAQTPIFRADHPFFFIIKHNPSNSLLFLGRLLKPS